MTKYIQITKASDNCWYTSIAQHNPIFEVTEQGNYYRVVASGWVIKKEDCEEVALPTINQEVEEIAKCLDSDMAHLYTNNTLRELAHQVAEDFEKTAGHYWSFKKAFWKGCKAMEQVGQTTPDGAHLITTEQLKELYKPLNDTHLGSDAFVMQKLQEWFPAVFAPAKTYKVGDRFKSSTTDSTYRLVIHANGRIAFLAESMNIVNRYSIKVENPDKITQPEFNELVSWNSYYPQEFTLLPDTTALEEYNKMDNTLPNALKGGQSV